jgi:hypothetical protein
MCFSLDWLLHILILGVIVAAVFAILKLVVPWALSKMGGEVGEGVAMLMRVFSIVIWAVVIIVVLIIVFYLISCLISWGGGGFSVLPHR